MEVDTEGSSAPAEPTSQGSGQRASQTPRAAKPLPTDRLKFDMQVQALKAIVVESNNGTRGVTSADIAKRIGVSEATAGLNNAWFLDVGLINRESKGSYKPSNAAIEFSRLDGFDPVAAKKPLAEVLVQDWSYDEIMGQGALNDTSVDRIIQVLANSAKASKAHEPKLKALLDWLEFASLIAIEGGQVELRSSHDAADAVAKAKAQKAADEQAVAEEQAAAEEALRTPDGSKGKEPTNLDKQRGPVVLEFKFDMVLTADDLAKLGPEQIQALYAAVGGAMAARASLSTGEDRPKK